MVERHGPALPNKRARVTRYAKGRLRDLERLFGISTPHVGESRDRERGCHVKGIAKRFGSRKHLPGERDRRVGRTTQPREHDQVAFRESNDWRVDNAPHVRRWYGVQHVTRAGKRALRRGELPTKEPRRSRKDGRLRRRYGIRET